MALGARTSAISRLDEILGPHTGGQRPVAGQRPAGANVPQHPMTAEGAPPPVTAGTPNPAIPVTANAPAAGGWPAPNRPPVGSGWPVLSKSPTGPVQPPLGSRPDAPGIPPSIGSPIIPQTHQRGGMGQVPGIVAYPEGLARQLLTFDQQQGAPR